MRRQTLTPFSAGFSRWAVGVAAAAYLSAMAGCHRNQSAPPPARPPTASPVVQGESSGLEVWSWLVSDGRDKPVPMFTDSASGQPPPEPNVRIVDDRPSLEALLSPYLARPLPVSEELRERWRACGFRIVAIPAADLEPLQDRMRLIGQVQRQWMGEMTRWTDVARGPELDEPRHVTLDSGDLTLEAGRVSLSARCWSTPIATADGQTAPALRLELAPQHAPRVDPVDRWRAAAGLGASIQSERFARLALEMLLTTPGEAYLITADNPDADWGNPESRPPTPRQESGPMPPRAPTLGELMLSAGANGGRARVRAVVVLVPRIPTRFDLLP